MLIMSSLIVGCVIIGVVMVLTCCLCVYVCREEKKLEEQDAADRGDIVRYRNDKDIRIVRDRRQTVRAVRGLPEAARRVRKDAADSKQRRDHSSDW